MDLHFVFSRAKWYSHLISHDEVAAGAAAAAASTFRASSSYAHLAALQWVGDRRPCFAIDQETISRINIKLGGGHRLRRRSGCYQTSFFWSMPVAYSDSRLTLYVVSHDRTGSAPAVWPTDNWLGSNMNHIQGWKNVWLCYCHAFEKECLDAM